MASSYNSSHYETRGGVVIGNYTIQEETLGKGSNATVKLGINNRTKETVAIKIVDISTPSKKQKACLEADLLSTLYNENIIKLLGVERTENFMFLIMEYVAGGDLSSYIEQYGRLEEGRARRYFKQIIDAVDHCHETRIVHHDIKLENILISEDRKSLRLVDFGMGSRMREDARLTNYVGSPLFMSPEVFSLQPHDAAVDVWSLGVCLFKMMTDLFPFVAETYHELEERVLFDEVSFPSNLGLSCELKDLIQKMLVKDPRQRITLKEIKAHSWMTQTKSSSAKRTTYSSSPIPMSYLSDDYHHSMYSNSPTQFYFSPPSTSYNYFSDL
eukprot:TRINITY_DN1562_c0_g2_i1.p1 TRINITY_DN1562_c0_g2~~TRINITY_DN1562_c0_g2_i1.p1  ORF type:complete len:328 (-),score=27.39 TRINITY_DN1562_c0_g2_i1:97-1080(-)